MTKFTTNWRGGGISRPSPEFINFVHFLSFKGFLKVCCPPRLFHMAINSTPHTHSVRHLKFYTGARSRCSIRMKRQHFECWFSRSPNPLRFRHMLVVCWTKVSLVNYNISRECQLKKMDAGRLCFVSGFQLGRYFQPWKRAFVAHKWRVKLVKNEQLPQPLDDTKYLVLVITNFGVIWHKAKL